MLTIITAEILVRTTIYNTLQLFESAFGLRRATEINIYPPGGLRWGGGTPRMEGRSSIGVRFSIFPLHAVPF